MRRRISCVQSFNVWTTVSWELSNKSKNKNLNAASEKLPLNLFSNEKNGNGMYNPVINLLSNV